MPRATRRIYAEDRYVERTFSEEAASAIHGIRTWLTNEYDHNGLRVDGERILGRPIDLARTDLVSWRSPRPTRR